MKNPPSEDYVRLRLKIRSLREEIKHSQAALGDALDVGQPAYEQKENGKTHFSIEDLFRLSRYYGICILDLFRDNMSEQEFSDYWASRGYVLKEVYEKRMKTLHEQNCSLEQEIDRLRAVNQQLAKDKALLGDILKKAPGMNGANKEDYKKS